MKKKLLSLLCVVLLVVGAVVGTYAYLIDTDSALNTFTVGQVGLDLKETKTDEYGVATNNTTDEGNQYKLIPGHTYVKDPKVTVDAESEDSFVRMVVTVKNVASLKLAVPADKYPAYYAEDGVFLLEKLCVDETGTCTWDKDCWKFASYTEKDGNGVYEFRYKEVVNTLGAAAKPLDALFTDITVPSFLDKAGLEYLGQVKINVEAHAIQADGFDKNLDKNGYDAEATAAWTAFDAQPKN